MLIPEVLRRSGFDDFFEHPFGMPAQIPAMKTDVRESENGYELKIDLPGIQRENVRAELHNGHLTISATTAQNHDEKDENGRYIRRERFSGSYSRSFYVGEGVTEEDIKAKFTDGVLRLDIPKKERTAPEKKCIAIES